MTSFIILSITSVVLFIFLCISIYFNYRFGVIIINTQEQVESSLDLLDQRYKKMSDIAKTPVFFDSVEIRQVINEINKCVDAVLLVANKLMSVSEQEKGENNIYDKSEEKTIY